ncbi:hypothetical protein KP509_17G073400 [Ceratopteris richardii]|nr:hypothetical protein KP509_17G073400 [Ceratopteris richardii]
MHLVPMLAESGLMRDAQHVLDLLPDQHESLWNSILSGYVRYGQPQQALSLYAKMQDSRVHPSTHTFVPVLSACAKLKDIQKGREVHAEAARHGVDTEVHVGSTLVDMYTKCDLPFKAQEVFNRLAVRSVVTWNSLIAGFSANGFGERALYWFEKMQLEGITPNSITYVCTLKACGSSGAIDKAQDIHSEVSKCGLEKDLYVGSTLVDMYANVGCLAKAEAVFDKLTYRDVVSWTSLMNGYVEHGQSEKALQAYQQMQLEGNSPNKYAFVCTLKACGSAGAISKGLELHACIPEAVSSRDSFIGSALINMYTDHELFARAHEILHSLHNDVISWNSLIAGYVKHGRNKEALGYYHQMKVKGLTPNTGTYASILKACSTLGLINVGKAIHTELIREDLATELVIGSALVDMYANCGYLTEAQEIFDKLEARNVISWTALISGYVKHGAHQEALDHFDSMEREGISPEATTLICILKACGLLGATEKGRAIHAAAARKALDRELIVGSSLVDMYANCGLLFTAQEVFDCIPVRDAACWNALLVGYAQLGESYMVFRSFDKMGIEGYRYSVTSFISVLNACSHAGLVDLGKEFFKFMSERCDIIPTLQHHSCLIDLLGRAGLLEESIAIINRMPFLPNLVIWHTLLGAVRKWSIVDIGRGAFEQAIELNRRDSSAYLHMFGIFSEAHMQDDAFHIQALGMKNMAGL